MPIAPARATWLFLPAVCCTIPTLCRYSRRVTMSSLPPSLTKPTTCGAPTICYLRRVPPIPQLSASYPDSHMPRATARFLPRAAMDILWSERCWATGRGGTASPICGRCLTGVSHKTACLPRRHLSLGRPSRPTREVSSSPSVSLSAPVGMQETGTVCPRAVTLPNHLQGRSGAARAEQQRETRCIAPHDVDFLPLRWGYSPAQRVLGSSPLPARGLPEGPGRPIEWFWPRAHRGPG